MFPADRRQKDKFSMEFHIASRIRKKLKLDDLLFSFAGNVVFANVAASRKLAQQLNELNEANGGNEGPVNAAALFAMGLIDELSHALIARYRKEVDPELLSEAVRWFGAQGSPVQLQALLLAFVEQFPTVAVYRGELTPSEWLRGSTEGLSHREVALEEMLLLWLANSNPAFAPFHVLFEDRKLKQNAMYKGFATKLPKFFVTRPPMPSGLGTLLDALRAPMLASPDSLTGQLDFIRENWSEYLGEDLRRVLLAIDVLREEEVAIWMRFHPGGAGKQRDAQGGRGGEGFVGDEFMGFESEFVTGADGVRRRRYADDYQAPLNEYEAFSADQQWMPTVVLIAKNTYVWLEQLSKTYGRHIYRLDQIPEEELQTLASRGITGLWLIGLWERSRASKTIKRLRGNSDAVASAYSLKDYLIAEDLGGEAAYETLRNRAAAAGLRLASDMVPNHMGIDSDWVIDHPEWFLSRWESPFPVYSFEGPDLSTDSRVEIKIEDHYYDQTDAAVVFRLKHHRDGNTRYMYHGNDGTTFAWNDTAQLDYSRSEVREHVIQVILAVARRFPIIRFDAAMVLARRHVQRLWFPLPGAGGAIPSRAENAMSQEAFDELMPNEFWREVVDRVAVEVPGTLLLAEAFWLLEGYFVRTLGMHRVYNSAFMNMLRDEENAKYRSYLKKTVEFDPDILKRYVNFMSNPDERTAIDQFGSGDKYFGVSVLLATLPGLPMFGHGQVEGYTERYGMDFKQALLDERPNEGLIERHQQLIAPLLKSRHIFAESTNFLLYDFWVDGGSVDENVFAFSNSHGDQRALILYNNRYESTRGTVQTSVGFLEKQTGSLRQKSLNEGLGLPYDDRTILAYRDTVQGLEYLRRARDFRDYGLTLDLHGYQHVVLLEWRELQSSEACPWERLCDSLHGAGVHSVDEALQQLLLQPVVDALCGVVNESSIKAFAEAAEKTIAPKTIAPPQERSEETEPGLLATANGAAADTSTPSEPSNLDQFVLEYAESLGRFVATATRLLPAESKGGSIVAEGTTSGPQSAAAGGDSADDVKAIHDAEIVRALTFLPALVSEFPKALQVASRSVLPAPGSQTDASLMWAPVLAWAAMQAFPSAQTALAAFDDLRARQALAATFARVGLHGEETWRAAAKVRTLLLMGVYGSVLAAIGSVEFWEDGDVRWLTGVHRAGDKTEYFNQEAFEAFVSWLQLPALLSNRERSFSRRDAEIGSGGLAEALAGAGQAASYDLSRFLDALNGVKTSQQKHSTKDSTKALAQV
jgi:hypothetical protein